MTIFATFSNLTCLTATLAAGTLAAVDGTSAKDVEVPTALNLA
jgi:hypothetical protein